MDLSIDIGMGIRPSKGRYIDSTLGKNLLAFNFTFLLF